MNNHPTKKAKLIYRTGKSSNIALMVIFLLCGIVFGCLFSSYSVIDSGSVTLRNDIISVVQSKGAEYSFWKAYINLVKYPIIIFLLSFTVFGYVAIPFTVLVKSFFLSYSISSVLKLYGTESFFLSMSMFGIQSLLSIPVLLMISSVGFDVSRLFCITVKKTGHVVQGKENAVTGYIILFCIILLFLLLFTFLDISLTPSLISLALNGQ